MKAHYNNHEVTQDSQNQKMVKKVTRSASRNKNNQQMSSKRNASMLSKNHTEKTRNHPRNSNVDHGDKRGFVKM